MVLQVQGTAGAASRGRPLSPPGTSGRPGRSSPPARPRPPLPRCPFPAPSPQLLRHSVHAIHKCDRLSMFCSWSHCQSTTVAAAGVPDDSSCLPNDHGRPYTCLAPVDSGASQQPCPSNRIASRQLSRHPLLPCLVLTLAGCRTLQRPLDMGSRPPTSPQQPTGSIHSRAATPTGRAAAGESHPFRHSGGGGGEADPQHTTDLSVAYSLARRSTSFSGGRRPLQEIIVRCRPTAQRLPIGRGHPIAQSGCIARSRPAALRRSTVHIWPWHVLHLADVIRLTSVSVLWALSARHRSQLYFSYLI